MLRRRWRALLLASVAACAACGLIYELALLTLSTSLAGGGIVETSLIVAGYVAALGAGALLVKPLLHRAAVTFVTVETMLALVGGLSATALYLTFAYIGSSVWVLVLATALIGSLVGAEVPLLMTLLQQGRTAEATDSGRVLANLNAADYLGALLGGLAWPFLLLPALGMLRGAAVTGMINLGAAAILALFLLRHLLSRRALVFSLMLLAAAAAVLITLLVGSRNIETTARQALYADPIIAYERSDYQEIVVTQRGSDTRLYLDGGLQFSTRDEYRYTESLVYPALQADTRSVLILGGGDGLAARELLRVPSVEHIVQVELDPEVLELARTMLSGINKDSLADPRVHVIVDDAMAWLRQDHPAIPDGGFDAVLIDLPDPDTPQLGRLYSTEFYGLAARVLAPDGRMVVQSGSPYFTTDAYWRTVSSVQAAGLAVTPYHIYVPTFGGWGFTLAAHGDTPPAATLPPGLPGLRFLDQQVLDAAVVFPDDMGPRVLEPSTLAHPRIVEDMRHGYR
ncbi:polyamine aminopropyltransferase [Tomitella fengzijianii]|uniref:Polyamine aminopropyltransferase n=1 Tax=Tomitella fengzijianii TaxID=2597660 RepID=A0A516X7Y6_9ACTN|nr:polyamine aminopropyltransferase [Tomitella fengzijianii]QDQ99177.1 polyamine aminopropyltransferase [Tomitella fengzijianii]